MMLKRMMLANVFPGIFGYWKILMLAIYAKPEENKLGWIGSLIALLIVMPVAIVYLEITLRISQIINFIRKRRVLKSFK